MDGSDVVKIGGCFVMYGVVGNIKNDLCLNCDWWLNQFNLKILYQNGIVFSLMGVDFDYIVEFEKLDYVVVKVDFVVLMIDSQDWWLVDYGYYGLFFICMVWYSVGIYWMVDGCGGVCFGIQWFVLLNSWLDNGNLDKVCCLLWFIK